MRVLMVDDDPIVCQAVRDTLEAEGHTVQCRNTALGTLADIRRHDPEVIILDVGMPGLSGDRLLGLIRNAFPKIQIVIYSADADVCASKLDADALLQKGSTTDLVRCLRSLRLAR
jgi:DNA-binding NarL/FixJ family response regulator